MAWFSRLNGLPNEASTKVTEWLGFARYKASPRLETSMNSPSPDMEKGKLHIVLLPWLAFGHMIPYLDLAKRLARMGHRVSYLSTPRNIDRLPTVPPDLQPQLNFVKLTTSPVAGLPEDAQSTSDAPSHLIPLIMKLQDGMEGPLRAFIQDNPFPDWIIYDMFHHWAPAVAVDYGISSVFFTILPAMTHCFIGPASALLDSREDPSPHHFTAPPQWIPFPTNLAWRYHDAVRLTKNASSISSVTGVPMNHRIGKAIKGCDVAAVRSCIDFEPEWIQLLGQLYQKPVFPMGFLSPSATGSNNMIDEQPLAVLEWLDKQKPGSTVYVAFGSEWQLNREEVHEIAIGLERSGLPFFWAYRADEDLLPEGFQDRIKSLGLIHVGWAPQGRLLAHKSIGCFLTHAGWGSTVEGLALGKPLVTLPMHADQGLIALRMAEKKVGVDVPRKEEDGSFEGDGVAKCLKLVMLEEGELIRSNALQMMKIFGNEKRNNLYIEEFVNYLIESRQQNSISVPISDQLGPLN